MANRTMLGCLLIGTAAAIFLASTPALAGPQSRWLHVRVEGKGPDVETVHVNLPLSLLETVLPAIDQDGLRHGIVRIRRHDGDRHPVGLGHSDLDAADLRAILAAVRDAEDGEYVTVDDPDERVRVWKEKGLLCIDAEERGDSPEKVHVRIRMDVLSAMLTDDPDELDVVAAVRVLGERDEGDLIVVTGEDEAVHIWIDGSSASE